MFGCFFFFNFLPSTQSSQITNKYIRHRNKSNDCQLWNTRIKQHSQLKSYGKTRKQKNKNPTIRSTHWRCTAVHWLHRHCFIVFNALKRAIREDDANYSRNFFRFFFSILRTFNFEQIEFMSNWTRIINERVSRHSNE